MIDSGMPLDPVDKRPIIVTMTTIEISILVALADEPLHAYAIARKCDEDAGGEGVMSNGTLHPALFRLEASGVIELDKHMNARSGPGRKIWRLSRKGRMMLELELAAYRRLVRLGHERL
jgi:PadR family transcriptional regulator, regulatory protein PadR